MQEPSTCSNNIKNTQLKVATGKHNGGDFQRLVVLNKTPVDKVYHWLHSAKLPQQERGMPFTAQNPMEEDRADLSACTVCKLAAL